MKRPQNFDELLNIAKVRPDVHGALSQLGISLKRAGYSMGGNRWQTATKSGTAGDLSAIAFIEKPDGSWIIFDNKSRTGKQTLDPIALLQEIFGTSFDDAVYMLSGGAPQAPVAKPKAPTLERKTEPQEKPTYIPPTPADDKIKNVMAYLIQTRKLPKELVIPLIDCGKIYATYYENPETHKQTLVCAFKITDENGNNVGCDSCAPQPNFKFKHLFTGSNADYAWCFPYEIEEITTKTPIFFCEAPIDTMSLCALSGTPGVYVSMAGLKDRTFNSITEKLGGKPFICVDNDEAGDKFAARHPGVPRMIAPNGKDWNDTLKYYVENGISYAYAPPKTTAPNVAATPDVSHQDNVGGGHAVHLENEERDQKKENGALLSSAPEENYLAETTDGRLVAIINKDILKNIDINNWNKETKEAIKKIAKNELLKFKGKIAVNGITIEINRRSALEYTRSNYTDKLSKKSPEDFINKMRAAARLDNVLIATANFTNDGGIKKNRKDDFVDFCRGKTLFSSNGKYYEAEVLLAIDKNGAFTFYDLLEVYPSTLILKNDLSQNKRKNLSIATPKLFGDMPEVLTTDSIPQNSEKVNTLDEKNSKPLNDEAPFDTEDNDKHSQDVLRATLEAKVADVVNNYRADPRALAEYVLFSSKFNNYSANNLRLIWAQYPHAQYVTSAYDFSHGLPDKNGKPTVSEKIFVKKGERALRVWKPYDVKYTVMPDGSEKRSAWLTKSEREQAKIEKWKELTRKYFILVPVFDITQTTASPDVYPKLCGLGGIKGTSADARFNALKNYCENVLNCPVKVRDFGERKATVRGSFYPDRNEIHISDMLEGENKLSTFIHEIGHATLHADSYKNAAKSTAQIELEADMYALMIERRLGIEPTDARCRHLKAHYDKYIAEIKSTDINADTELFNNVIDRYREQIPLIDAYVDNLNVVEAQLKAAPTSTLEENKRFAALNDSTPIENEYLKAVTELETISDEKYLKSRSKEPFILVSEHTPNIILDTLKTGNDRQILIRRDALYLALRESGVQEGHYHGLGRETLLNLPNYLEDPDVILSTEKNKEERRLLLTNIPSKNGQGIISLEFETIKDFKEKREKFNLVVTFFDVHKNYLNTLFKNHGAKILKQKEDVAQLNPQLYEWLRSVNATSSINSISENSEKVNTFSKNQNTKL